MHRGHSKLDLAYGCFAYCGLAAIAIGAMSWFPMDSGVAGTLGLLLAVPMALAALAAMLAGIVLSLMLWRHWPLPLLSALSLLLVAEIVGEFGSVELYNAAPIVYGVVSLAISGICFVSGRNRRS
jgi:hypothetical protein